MELYFQKFPIISYNNITIRNISERVSVLTTPKLAPMNYYPYELGNGLRPDQIARNYYSDPTLDWLIWVVNGIVDPYYGWYLYDEDFKNYIDSKYGDLDTASQSIAFWRTNWPSDVNEITSDYFDRLDGSFKKYYEPVWGAKTKILSYRRKQDDLMMNTNKISKYSITMNSANNFANGELLHFYYSDVQIGFAECITANSTEIIVRNHVGNTSAGTIRSRASKLVNAEIVSITTMVNNIPDVEGKYWEYVSWWDVETEKNEGKRFIDLLDVNQVMPIAEEIRKALQ